MAARRLEPAFRMAVLRGKGRGIEVDFAERPFEEALDELQERLAANPGFYTGSPATAVFAAPPAAAKLAALRAALSVFGITLEGLSGPPDLEPIARDADLVFALRRPPDPNGELAVRRANRPRRELTLSEAARSLAADFAGARADLAARRNSSVPIRQFPPAVAPPDPSPVAQPLSPVPQPPPVSTLYQVGTVRGGQSLHHVGNLVVVGDVNPGSELVASGDIVVFGALRGVAHAGAQGDASARIYALALEATQLRIAALIAAEDAMRGRDARLPEVACVLEGRIGIVPYERAAEFPAEDEH